MKSTILLSAILIGSSALADPAILIQCRDHAGASLVLTAASWQTNATGFLKTASGSSYNVSCKPDPWQGNISRGMFLCETTGINISIAITADPDRGIYAQMNGGPWLIANRPTNNLFCDF